ncbi:hypothetical protein Drorol1_Dr00019447 [Drosera rotundifolia]
MLTSWGVSCGLQEVEELGDWRQFKRRGRSGDRDGCGEAGLGGDDGAGNGREEEEEKEEERRAEARV